jgi:pilus assembly protein FimV
VKKGDTLAPSRARTKPDGVTLNQMLTALYRANEDAFIRGNVNLVRAGRILNIPDREAIAATSAAEPNACAIAHVGFRRVQAQTRAAVAARPRARARARSHRTHHGQARGAGAGEQKDQLKLSKADP